MSRRLALLNACLGATQVGYGEPDERAAELIEALAANGYQVETSPGSPQEYGRYSVLNDEEHLEAMNWATSWIRLDATRPDGFTARARVADGLTLNNCFPDFGDVITAADPHAADVVTVLMFRGPSPSDAASPRSG